MKKYFYRFVDHDALPFNQYFLLTLLV